MKKTVLITGANGTIGTILLNALAETFTIRALSRKPLAETEALNVDISDLDALLPACEGVDSIIHLAAKPSVGAPWDDVLSSNIIGTYNVFEAARRNGVKQVIFASTNHTVGAYELKYAPALYHTGQPLLDHLVPVRPDSLYGVSKCFGEALGRYYADHHGLRVLCLRIGYINAADTPYPEKTREPRDRLAAMWLSHRDCIQLVTKSLHADHVKFDIVYGISNNRPHFYDLEHAREVIGYEPEDGADVSLVRKK